MDDASSRTLRHLLTERRFLSLAVVVDGEPVIGLLPFAAEPGFSALVVNASKLARHTRGLTEGAAFDALIHEPETPHVDPFQVVRASLRGHVTLLDRDGSDYDADRATYLAKFPGAGPILELGDFRLFRLHLEAGRLVARFGGALNLGREHFARLKG